MSSSSVEEDDEHVDRLEGDEPAEEQDDEEGSVEESDPDACEMCCMPYDSKEHEPLQCRFCKVYYCGECIKKYLLSSFTEAKCMGCKKFFLRHHLLEMFPKSWVDKEYRKHKESLIYEQEKSHFKDTQDSIETEKHMKRLRRLEFIRNQEAKMVEPKFAIKKYDLVDSYNDSLVGVTDKVAIGKLKKKHAEFMDKLYKDENNERELLYKKMKADQEKLRKDRGIFGTDSEEEESKKKFIQKCRRENCKGFLSTQWKCGLCENYTCKDCLEFIGSGIQGPDGLSAVNRHTCTQANIATAKLLKADTKQCPNCQVDIFRSEGCSNMFCTVCHVGFNWSTLVIQRGEVHNPHYDEYKKSLNTTLHTECVTDILHDYGYYTNMIQHLKEERYFRKVYTNLQDIETDKIRTLTEFHEKKANIRKDLLLNKITDQEFKRRLYIFQKKIDYKDEVIQILRMIITVGPELLNKLGLNKDLLKELKLVSETDKTAVFYYDLLNQTAMGTRLKSLMSLGDRLEEESIKVKEEIEKFREYCNIELQEVGDVHETKDVWLLDESFRLLSNFERNKVRRQKENEERWEREREKREQEDARKYSIRRRAARKVKRDRGDTNVESDTESEGEEDVPWTETENLEPDSDEE